MLFFGLYNKARVVVFFQCVFILPCFIFSQTTLSPGDIAIVGFKTNTNTQTGNDAVKLVCLTDISCGTEFIITDNNWNGSSWACNDDEFGIQIFCNSNIAAGSIFYIDVDASGGTASCSGGTITKTNLGSPWGTNFGLNSQGDNLYVLQGTRASPVFIFALKHAGAFASSTCSSRNEAGLPSNLTIGQTALQMPLTANQWTFNYVTNSGTKASLLSAIGNSSNWLSNTSHVWDVSNGIISVSGTFLYSGVLAVSGAGCGCLANCQLAYSGSINCGTGVSGDCTAGYQNVSTSINVPSGCTYLVEAEMKVRPYSCGSSGADGNCQTCDVVKVDISGGTKLFQQGASNSALFDSYTAAGPATIVVSGRANRADEIITFKVSASPCNCFNAVQLSNDLVNFSIQGKDEAVQLNWEYQLTENLTYFNLERSSDAFIWESINTLIDSDEGFSLRKYSVYDTSPSQSLSYYRIRYYSENSEEKYSMIKSIDLNSASKKIIRRLNYLGTDSNQNGHGVLIDVYDDGTVKKHIVIPNQ